MTVKALDHEEEGWRQDGAGRKEEKVIKFSASRKRKATPSPSSRRKNAPCRCLMLKTNALCRPPPLTLEGMEALE